MTFVDRRSVRTSGAGIPGQRRIAAVLAVGLIGGLTSAIPMAGTAFAATDRDLSVESVTYSYTGGAQSFTVPAGISALQVTATGGSGGDDWYGPVDGGAGSTITLELPVGSGAPVQSGANLVVVVGGSGGIADVHGRPGSGGYNGGGWGGGSSAVGYPGSGGGGASDLRLAAGALEDRLVVAGGGGGAGGTTSDVLGGAGGPGGQPGWASATGQGGGTAGSPGHGAPGQGESGSNHYAAGGGGGGGGYNGGGAGGGSDSFPSAGGGGGGGSSYADASARNVAIEPVGSGTSQVIISWIDAPPMITPHEDVVVAVDEGQTEATVNYTKPNAYDAVDGQVPVTCSPAPGSVFGLGTTPVLCTASDRAGNTSSSTFDVIVSAPVPAEADLSVAVQGPRKARTGSEVSYVLTVTNSGPAAATDLTAVLDATGLSGISARPAARTGSFAVDGLTGSGTTWNLPTLDAGQFATFTISGTVKAKPGKKIKVLGLATSDVIDPDRDNNRDKLQTKVN